MEGTDINNNFFIMKISVAQPIGSNFNNWRNVWKTKKLRLGLEHIIFQFYSTLLTYS